MRKRDGVSGTMDFLGHVTADRQAWERIKPRFALSTDPGEPARIDQASYFAHFDPYPSWEEAVRKYRRIYATGRYMLFQAYGPWEATWRHRRMEDLLMDVAIEPDWVRDMADTYQDLVIAILGRCLDLGMKPDGFFMVEDLGSTRSTMISPESWRRVFKPAVARLGSFLQQHGIDFWMHSCGAVQPLLDDLVDCGLQVINPLQTNAGFDVVQMRKRYGGRLALYGNISVKKMLGARDELEQEIRRKVPVARQGGYIFHSDHSVPPQVSFERFCWILKTAREAFDG